ncbi:YlmC/YmxH family sporulation protein [Halothermothrix orenii]|uniref:Sporulation protein YlmC/YmxH n=1 Tax=Halothermothrix orenii (strain H 168 / OCM 544 / DSM 9562) TaxID=373903 RepID=B8CWK5_HALOH|nr:YlmC/YmxH family sporulation protein [Halothermothrix orenii]ACL69674.1 Sporulation protein YlmC/YmxH [Halothermothrix orenii H 168]
MVKKSELSLKDVVDISRGKKLGYIEDVEIDLDKGKIKAFVVPAHPSKVMRFFTKKSDLVINWEDIKKIGEDVILVNLNNDGQV